VSRKGHERDTTPRSTAERAIASFGLSQQKRVYCPSLEPLGQRRILKQHPRRLCRLLSAYPYTASRCSGSSPTAGSI
jgi:hypothetical protein